MYYFFSRQFNLIRPNDLHYVIASLSTLRGNANNTTESQPVIQTDDTLCRQTTRQVSTAAVRN